VDWLGLTGHYTCVTRARRSHEPAEGKGCGERVGAEGRWLLIDDDVVSPCPAALEEMLFSRGAATVGAGSEEGGDGAASGDEERREESEMWGWGDDAEVSDEDATLRTEAGAAPLEGATDGARAYMCLYTRVC
jgi:hypothetical protein